MTGHICPECGGERGSGHDSGTRPGGCDCGAGAARRAGGGHPVDGGQPVGDELRAGDGPRAYEGQGQGQRAGGGQAANGGQWAGGGQAAGEGDSAGDELRAARSAELAAAEDFDPLRIRPYVTLPGEGVPAGPGMPATGSPAGSPAGPSAGPPPGYATGPDSGVPDAATTMPLYLSGAAAGPLPDMAAGDESRRRTAGAYAGAGPDPVQPRRRRPLAVIAVGAAVAAVVGTAAFAGGLFGADDDEMDNVALPETTTSAPDTSSEPAQAVSESASASPSPSRSASPSPSAPPSPPSRSPEASRSASPTLATPSPSASPTKAAPTTSAPPVEDSGLTLRPGDQGEEVVELQRRLHEIWLYQGPADGNYSDRVERGVASYQSYMSIEGDPSGVYGPETRQALEGKQPSWRGRS